jgi:hypothetical protein
LAAAVSPTVPLLEPDPPDAIVIHAAELDAVQLQPVSVVTPTLSEPPAAPTLSVARLSE